MTENGKPVGWGYPQIGWLLEEVEKAGGEISLSFFPERDNVESYARARKERTELGFDMDICFQWDKMHFELTSGVPEKNRITALNSIENQLRLLLGQISHDSVLSRRLNLRVTVDPDTGVGFHGIVEGMKRLKKAVRREKENNENLSGTGLLPGGQGTQQAKLLRSLVNVYSKHFNAEYTDGLTKTWSNPKGPFVAFVNCAYQLAERQVPEGAAIYKALDRAKLLPKKDKR